MEGKKLTPPSPPLSGGVSDSGKSATTPSPDKGRAGEGLGYLSYDKRLTTFARANRRAPTLAENLLWQKVLRGRQLKGYKFLRQKPIGPYVVDFYCAEAKLVIEVDGDSHADQAEYDTQRTIFLESRGLRVLRYANRDVLNNLSGVYEHLQIQLETP